MLWHKLMNHCTRLKRSVLLHSPPFMVEVKIHHFLHWDMIKIYKPSQQFMSENLYHKNLNSITSDITNLLLSSKLNQLNQNHSYLQIVLKKSSIEKNSTSMSSLPSEVGCLQKLITKVRWIGCKWIGLKETKFNI